jgi:hypothetical protein
VRLARVHLAWRAGNHRDVDTLKSSACPLAGWLRYQGIRLEPPSIRASRYKDWTPNTAYARGVMITGHLKRPICQNGGVGPAPGAFTGTSINWQATSMRSVSPLLPWFHATQHPLSGHVPSSGLQPWSVEKTAEESPSMSRRQARAVSGWRSRESPQAARTAREQCAGGGPRPRCQCAACACLPEQSAY